MIRCLECDTRLRRWFHCDVCGAPTWCLLVVVTAATGVVAGAGIWWLS